MAIHYHPKPSNVILISHLKVRHVYFNHLLLMSSTSADKLSVPPPEDPQGKGFVSVQKTEFSQSITHIHTVRINNH